MTFTQCYNAFKARYKLFLSIFFICISLAILVFFVTPKKYTANTIVIVNYKGTDPLTGLVLPSQLLPGYMATQVDIITSKSTAIKVIERLQLDKIEKYKKKFISDTEGRGDYKDWLADIILKNLEVTPSKKSSTIDIEYKAKDPESAARIASAFASAYIDKSLTLKNQPAKSAAYYYREQVGSLENKLQESQKKLYAYQTQNGLLDDDVHLNIENARLNELSTQLIAAQTRAMEASSRQQSSSRNAEDSPDISSNITIQNLKAQLAQAETRFADVSAQYDKKHPLYIASQAQVDKLKSELNNQVSSTSNSVGISANIYNQQVAKLQSQVNEQKLKVVNLNKGQEELATLMREVETNKKAYTAATQGLNQNDIQAQYNQTDVTILYSATPQYKPSSPKKMIFILGGILFSITLGGFLVLLVELFDRRIRSAEDILSMTGMPILGEFSKKLN
ncbi:MAG TPA: chain length determinant protein EpsF [Methylophilaceae bacterium]|jgi:chain length determinant protein EpsF